MRTITFLTVALLAAPAFGVTQWMDAAELDRSGQPLGFAGVRAFIDNRAGHSDLTDVLFKFNWTGQSTMLGGITWIDPRNPWFGASNANYFQVLNGLYYITGTIYYPPTREWGPYFEIWSDPEGMGPKWGIEETVPAGLVWDACMFVQGPDVRLFHSPASGQTSFDGQTYVLYDDDPMPQTVPGPGVMILLVLGAAIIRRR